MSYVLQLLFSEYSILLLYAIIFRFLIMQALRRKCKGINFHNNSMIFLEKINFLSDLMLAALRLPVNWRKNRDLCIVLVCFGFVTGAGRLIGI